MATVKSYTDLQQSKKLAEILPLESADMFWRHCNLDNLDYPIMQTSFEYKRQANIPCWSLAALLDVIPKRIKHYNVLTIDISENDTSIWYDEIAYRVNNDLPDITKNKPIDACYEMIIRLHELNLL